MLQTTKLIVNNFKLFFLFFPLLLIADNYTPNDIPFHRGEKVIVPAKVKEYTTFEFPFEISEVSRTAVMPLNNMQYVSENVISLPGADGNNSGSLQNSNGGYVFERGKNTITLFGQISGNIDMVVWGAGKIVQFRVMMGDKGYPNYRFKDFDAQAEKELQSNDHVSIICNLVKSLRNNSVLDGYKRVILEKEEKYKSLKLKRVQILMGKKYYAEEWDVENIGSEVITQLYRESFLKTGIYGVWLLSRSLKPSERTRLFIVGATIGSKNPSNASEK